MQEIGDLLKRTRQAKGLTIDDVQEATKIRARYLEAMEEGRFDVLPGEVYVKGFLRNYADFVGLSGDEVVAQYKAKLARLQAEKVEEKASSPKRAGITSKFRIGRRLALYVGILCVVLLVVGALTWQPRHVAPGRSGIARGQQSGEMSSGGNLPIVSDEAVPGGPEAIPDRAPDTGQVGIPSQAGVAPGGTAASGGAPTDLGQPAHDGAVQPSNGGQQLSVVVSERCWVRVVADGKVVFERSMLAGESAVWRAKKTIRIKVGNASGIDITFNGVHVGTLGKSGEVVERAFP